VSPRRRLYKRGEYAAPSQPNPAPRTPGRACCFAILWPLGVAARDVVVRALAIVIAASSAMLSQRVPSTAKRDRALHVARRTFASRAEPRVALS
jgi:hypothetical protein